MTFFEPVTVHSPMRSHVREAGVLVVCPGFHSSKLTEQFLTQLTTICSPKWSILVVPTERYAAYSSLDVLRFLYEKLNTQTTDAWLRIPIIFMAFSAGVAGALGAALTLEAMGGEVTALFALDGWGVPVMGHFPVHRMSHDYFTHWSSALLGAGQDSFYAEPSVDHLEMWRSPQTISGYCVTSSHQKTQTTAFQFIEHWLNIHITKKSK